MVCFDGSLRSLVTPTISKYRLAKSKLLKENKPEYRVHIEIINYKHCYA